jgi:cell division protein FtsQ
MLGLKRRLVTRTQGRLPVMVSSSAFAAEGTSTRTRRAHRRNTRLMRRVRGWVGPVSRYLPYLMVALVTAAVPLGAVKLYVYMLTSPHFAVTQVRVEGNDRVDRDAVLSAAGIAYGGNILSIDEERAEAGIRALPWVAAVDVATKLPDTVLVTVRERTAVAVVVEERSWLVDADGQIFKELEPGELSDGLLVIGGVGVSLLDRLGDQKQVRELVAEALSLTAEYRRLELERYGKLTGVDYDRLAGFTLVTEQRSRFVLGVGDAAAKLERLSVVLSDLGKRGAAARTVRLDNEKQPWKVAVAGTHLRFVPEEVDVGTASRSRDMLP